MTKEAPTLELTTVGKTAPAMPAPSEAASILAVISKVAADPATDVVKLERLMAMYERLNANRARADYTAALSEMQPELPTIDANGKILHNGKLISQYAKWEDVNDVIKPILAQHGFTLEFGSTQGERGITVTAYLSHVGGFARETSLTLGADKSGAKNDVQAVGSTISYGKRYTAGMLLNLTSRAPGDVDDDGTAAGTITNEQADELRLLADEVKGDLAKMCAYFRIPTIHMLPAKDFARAKAAIEAKRTAA